MDSETNTPAKPTVEPVEAEVMADPAPPISVTVAETPKAAKTQARKAKRPIAKKKAVSVRPVKAARAKVKTTPVRSIKAAAGTERKIKMAYDPTTLFASFPTVQAFEKLFADAAERGEEAVKRSKLAAEQLADITRANVDAFVEAGKIATSGAQSLGQEVLAKGRANVDHAASTVRSLAEAKTPADVVQVQSDYVRTAFDRLVEETSSLTESMVKLAGEAFEPISTRASLNAERFNELVA